MTQQSKIDELQARIILMERAIQWCLKNGVRRAETGGFTKSVCDYSEGVGYGSMEPIQLPPEFSKIIEAIGPLPSPPAAGE